MLTITTETGSVYTLSRNLVHVKSTHSSVWQRGSVFQLWASKVAFDSEAIHVPWAEEEKTNPIWEDSPIPVVGKRWYAGGKDEWRITTTVVSIDDDGKDDD